MGKTFRKRMAELNPDRRERIEAKADRLHKEGALQATPSRGVLPARQDGPDSAQASEED